MPRRPHETSGGRIQDAGRRMIRDLHRVLYSRGLPRKVGVYSHTLPEADYEGFRAMVDYFRQGGYRVAVGPDDFLGEADEPVLWISFDDCFRHWYNARQLFDDLDVRATFYVNTCAFRDVATDEAIRCYLEDALGVDPALETLTTAELRILHEDGHTIGAHTHSHPVMTSLPFEEAVAEIRTNKELLEELLEDPVHHFAYPFGMRRYFSNSLSEACKELDLRTVARAIPALLHTGQGPAELNRSGWDYSKSLEENVALLAIDGSRFERLTGHSAVG